MVDYSPNGYVSSFPKGVAGWIFSNALTAWDRSNQIYASS